MTFKFSEIRWVPMVTGVVFSALTILMIWGFLSGFAPKPYKPPVAPREAGTRKPMLDAVSAPAVQTQFDAVAALGDRFLGKPGFYQTEALIRARYQAAGLELLEQDIRTVAPQTEVAQALADDGTPADFAVYPFMPNYLQPVATSEAGITATLLEVDDEVLRSRPSFKGCFALINGARTAPKGYGYAFSKYAQLGFEGVVVSHPRGLDAMEWDQVTGMTSANPVNFLRVAADAGVFKYAGKTVTLRVRARFREVPNRTLVGIMKGQGGSRDALVIPCSYDALSMLPDRSPGLLQILPVAVQLQLLDGLAPYRKDLLRDTIFIAFGGRFNAHDPQDRLMNAIGAQGDRAARRVALQSSREDNARKLATVKRCATVLEGLLSDAAAVRVPEALASLDGDTAAFFLDQVRYVLNTIVFERSESVLAAKIRFEKGNAADVNRPEFESYQGARKAYDKAFSCAGLALPRLLADQAPFVAEVGLPSRIAARLSELQRHHEEQDRELGQSLALNAAFAKYDRLVVLASELVPAGENSGLKEALTLTMGRYINHGTGAQPLVQIMQASLQQLKLGSKLSFRFETLPGYGWTVRGILADQDTESDPWTELSIPAYTVVNYGRSYAAFGYPCRQPWMSDVASLSNSLQVMGAMALSLAQGNGEFRPLPLRGPSRIRGSVFLANVGQSILPDHPLAGAVVACKPYGSQYQLGGGYAGALLMQSDCYGRYGRDYSVVPFAINVWSFSPDAAGYDAQGGVWLIKDEGPQAQRLFTSIGLGPAALSGDINLICFRATPVTLLDLINPQSMQAYAGAALMKARGLSTFDSSYSIVSSAGSGGSQTTFIKPDEHFIVALKAGAADNEMVQTTRAFLLGGGEGGAAGDGSKLQARAPGSELVSRGFLAAETPLVRDVAREAAQSMVAVNGSRLALQDSYAMADELTHDFQGRSVERMERVQDGPALSRKESLLLSRDALTYATINHPVLRRNIFEAVAGILWYLGLLVPFAFFFEKLVFGFTDIRRQLGAHMVIFLVVFTLLKLLHPAFAMIRSSVMILLGFVIFMVSTGMLAMFSSRFKENLESIKKARGQVTAAEVNRSGAIMTAFMLGLNNMHRRRIRTLLTCGTLVLITFVMICFTSVQSDITNTTTAIGKAPFNGFVIKNQQFRAVTEAEVFALQTKYGDHCKVAVRSAILGTENLNSKVRQYPDLRIVRRNSTTVKEARPLSALILSSEEPLAPRLAVRGRWFTPEESSSSGGSMPVILSRAMAERLGLDLVAITAGTPVPVDINGESSRVCGVYEGRVLDSLLDLDGRNLLPFDIKALREVNKFPDGSAMVPDDAVRLTGDEVILMPRAPKTTGGMTCSLSVAVVLPPSLSPREARAEIETFMEQSGRQTFFGLDGYAFLGRRARVSSFVGLVDMLIPLIIAAMTVLNTIRGSVYERKDEIFVYNAVGIAPRHIFFMFFAEAFVYAVVGSVLGYILSQGTGRLLTALNLTGGLNMTFTSLGTVYASLTIAASVFISTWFPARTAMKIASPVEDLGWQLPVPEGDRLRFRLPFTFDWHDRIAVLAFFRRYFIDHSEGSSGPFYTGMPVLGVGETVDPLDPDGYVPSLQVPVWLKPFDLGVSQSLVITLPKDAETGEYVAEITLHRRSGALENWKRLNAFFVGRVRQHFLHWRAVKADERAVMFDEAKREFESGERGVKPEA